MQLFRSGIQSLRTPNDLIKELHVQATSFMSWRTSQLCSSRTI